MVARGNTARAIDGVPVVGLIAASRTSPPTPTQNIRRMKLANRQLALGGRSLLSPHRKTPRHRATEIVVHFRRHSVRPFPQHHGKSLRPIARHPIQPNEGISLQLRRKSSRHSHEARLVNMDSITALFRRGTQTPVTNGCCAIVWPAIQHSSSVPIWSKPVGTDPTGDRHLARPAARGFPTMPLAHGGPVEAEELLERDGRAWRPTGEEISTTIVAATKRKTGLAAGVKQPPTKAFRRDRATRCPNSDQHRRDRQARRLRIPSIRDATVSEKGSLHGSPLGGSTPKALYSLLAMTPPCARSSPGIKCTCTSATSAASSRSCGQQFSDGHRDNALEVPIKPEQSFVLKASTRTRNEKAAQNTTSLRTSLK